MDMVRSSASIGISLVISLFLLISCESEPLRYGVEFNEVRTEVGLAPLDKNWKIYKNSIDLDQRRYVIYINPSKVKENVPIHFSKQTRFTKDAIICEVDKYLSGQTYTTIDGEMDVSLVATYHFVKDTVHNKTQGWNFRLFSSTETNIDGQNLSKVQADSILTRWGFINELP